MPVEKPDFPFHSRAGLLLGPALFLLILLLPRPAGMSESGQNAAAVLALMGVWWISEATNIALTAMLPLALFPLLGVMSAGEVSGYFANHIVFLYVGGFIIALGMEKWNLHRRVALETILRFGTEPPRIVLGFMTATAFLSMWISNTATTMMMLPIAIAVVNQLAEFAEAGPGAGPEKVRTTFGLVLLLGVAYAASVGGVGTIIGSPTNVAFVGFAQERFPNEPPIAFLDWLLVGLPIVIVFLPVSWLYLCRFGADISLWRVRFRESQSVIEQEKAKLGPISPPERTVLAVSLATALLWIFRRPIELGAFSLPGWSLLFPDPSLIHDSTVAVAMALLLCVLPVNLSGGVQWGSEWRRFVMDWDTIRHGLPWGIVMLFGGGFALAGAIEKTGLAAWIGSKMGALEGAPVWVLVPLSCLLAVLLTETTSNVATVLMVSPVMAATAAEIGVPPYLLLVPMTIMASFAFMLPVATPPNAIVFSSGWITIPRMFRAGVFLDLIALLIVPAMVYLLGRWVFQFD